MCKIIDSLIPLGSVLPSYTHQLFSIHLRELSVRETGIVGINASGRPAALKLSEEW